MGGTASYSDTYTFAIVSEARSMKEVKMDYPVTKWARAIAERLSDEWDGKEDFPEDARY